jgi:hypothetical protein
MLQNTNDNDAYSVLQPQHAVPRPRLSEESKIESNNDFGMNLNDSVEVIWVEDSFEAVESQHAASIGQPLSKNSNAGSQKCERKRDKKEAAKKKPTLVEE